MVQDGVRQIIFSDRSGACHNMQEQEEERIDSNDFYLNNIYNECKNYVGVSHMASIISLSNFNLCICCR